MCVSVCVRSLCVCDYLCLYPGVGGWMVTCLLLSYFATKTRLKVYVSKTCRLLADAGMWACVCVCVCVCVSDRRGQPTIRDVDLEMVFKRIAGAVVYVSNSTIFIFFPGSGFSNIMNQPKQNTSDRKSV